VRQWIICTLVALSVVAADGIRKAVMRRPTPEIVSVVALSTAPLSEAQ
jgi:hypothetical protein